MNWIGLVPPAANTYTLQPQLAGYGPYGVTPNIKGFLGMNDITYFRKVVSLAQGQKQTAEIIVAVDNNVKIWLNGKQLGESTLMSASEWSAPFLTWNVDSSGVVTVKNNAKSLGPVSWLPGDNEFVFGMRNCGGGDRGAMEVSVTINSA